MSDKQICPIARCNSHFAARGAETISRVSARRGWRARAVPSLQPRGPFFHPTLHCRWPVKRLRIRSCRPPTPFGPTRPAGSRRRWASPRRAPPSSPCSRTSSPSISGASSSSTCNGSLGLIEWVGGQGATGVGGGKVCAPVQHPGSHHGDVALAWRHLAARYHALAASDHPQVLPSSLQEL